jgi:hypothetical protein
MALRGSSKKPSRFDSIPPGASFEDDVQLDELRQPWSLRFSEFIRLVCERYGFTEYRDEDGTRYLRSPNGQSFLVSGIDVDHQLEADTTGGLCLAWGLPPADFGLPAEEPDEGGGI